MATADELEGIVLPDDGENPSSIELEGPPPFPDFPPPLLALPPPLLPEQLIPQPEGISTLDSAPALGVPQSKLITVPLFESAEGGYGDSERGTREFTYNRCYGSVDPRWPKKLYAGALPLAYANSAGNDQAPIFATAWEDSSSLELLYFLQGDEIRYLQSTSGSSEVGANVLGNNATTGMFDDDGSGVPYLYAGFGGTANNIRRMNRAQTVTAASGTLLANLLLSLNGRAYRTVQPSSGTANSAISNCPPGSDRFTAANWSSDVIVGFAGTHINALISVRQAPVCIKPEGIFAYNESLDRWVNYTPSWTRFQHPDNGKGAFSLGDHAVIPMGDGGAVLFNGYTVKEIDPIPQNGLPGRHTTTSSLISYAAGLDRAVMGSTRHWIVAVTPPGAKGNFDTATLESGGNNLSSHFWTYYDDSAGTYTDVPETVGTNDPTDTQSITYNDVADFIYIGSLFPFGGFSYDPGVGGTVNTVVLTLTAEIYNGSSWVAITVRDLTNLGGAPLGQKGTVLFAEDPFDDQTWTQTAISGVTRFWVRLSFSGALTAAVTWNTMTIIPWYPRVDVNESGTASLEMDGIDRGGGLSHILMGKLDVNTGSVVWHDMGSGLVYGGAASLQDEFGVITYGLTGKHGYSAIGSAPGTHAVVLIGRNTIVTLAAPLDDRADTVFSYNTGEGLFEASAFRPAGQRSCKLKAIRVFGEGFDDVHYSQLYYTWDRGKPWSRCGGRITRLPAQVFSSSDDSGGTLFHWLITFRSSGSFASTEHPQVSFIEADFEVINQPIGELQEREIPTAVAAGGTGIHRF